jgi:protein-tyrosine phosphatase
MVDIHSHILYGLDDGAKDQADSLAMLRIAAETGTTDIVATPHADFQFQFRPDLIADRIQELNSITGAKPRIHRGCDFHLSIENVQACLKDHTSYTINGLNYLMVEFADALIPPSTEEILRQFGERGIVPVVTHPERNPILQESTARLQKWIEMGCLLQITAQSLTDRFGKIAQKSAWNWLNKGMVHVIASDAHDTMHRPPRLDIARDLIAERFGADTANLLLVENPGSILEGYPVSPMDGQFALMDGKKWYQFWR